MPEIAGQVADGFADAVREHEESWLSPLAVRSYESRGREHPEDECRLRTPFQRDRDRILHSKPFRRLKGKTQVFNFRSFHCKARCHRVAPGLDHMFGNRPNHLNNIHALNRTGRTFGYFFSPCDNKGWPVILFYKSRRH